MKIRFRFLTALGSAAAMAVVLAGCGGGGSSVSGGSVAGTGRAVVYITDSFREDFAHVWATIYHVEIVPQSGANIVLFDNPAGVSVDLKTLRDSTGARFSFLGGMTIPAGTYTAIKVTIGPTLQLFRNGEAVGSPLTVDPTLIPAGSTNPVLIDTFKRPKTVTAAGINTMIVDFNLAKFVVRGSNVLPVVEDGDENGLGDVNRHNDNDYDGTITGAISGTAPDLTFTLSYANAQTITVMTTASTTIFGNATLTTGSVVDVSGSLDPATGNLVATQVRVRPAGSNGHLPPRARGTATNINAAAGTFTLTLNGNCSFVPGQTTANVVTTSTTTYVADNGSTLSEADFFTALASTPEVTVEGTYDAASNTFTATTLKIVNASLNGGWEHDHHGFRPGIRNKDDWGHGLIH